MYFSNMYNFTFIIGDLDMPKDNLLVCLVLLLLPLVRFLIMHDLALASKMGDQKYVRTTFHQFC